MTICVDSVFYYTTKHKQINYALPPHPNAHCHHPCVVIPSVWFACCICHRHKTACNSHHAQEYIYDVEALVVRLVYALLNTVCCFPSFLWACTTICFFLLFYTHSIFPTYLLRAAPIVSTTQELLRINNSSTNTLKLQGDIFRVELVKRKVGSECFGKYYAKRRNRRIIYSELFSVLFQSWTQWTDLLLDTSKHELFAINTNPNSTHLVISYSQWTAQSFLC